MKRFLSILMMVVFVLSFLVLTGCSGDKKETTTVQAQSQKSAEQKAGAETPAELFAKGKKAEGMSYDFTMSGTGVSMSGKYWIQGNKFKAEANMEGHKVVTIFDGEAFYTYNPDEKTAMKITPDKSKKSETPMDYVKDAESNPDRVKVVESVTYDGTPCKVIIVTGADGKEQSKMWVREDYGIPVRVEYADVGGNKSVMEYKNLKIGPQPPDAFKLPAGVQVQDLGELMKQMPQLPGGKQ